MNGIARLIVGVLLVVGVVSVVNFAGGEPANEVQADGDGTPVPVARRWQSSQECKECHQDVWDEWYGSHHQISYLNPEVRKLSDDFRQKACQACHLPQPVAVTGFAERTLPRNTRADEGVGCISCHLGANGEILGPRTLGNAPCKPVASQELLSVQQCESCHNQHFTTDQYRETHWFQDGVSCNDCHMHAIERTASDGTKRWGRHHGFPASHDKDMLLKTNRFEVAWEDDELFVSVKNVFAGHHFPTEERSRASDVMVRFDSEYGEGQWTQAWRFRMPYRDEPLENTQLHSDDTKEVRIPVPEGTTAIQARLWYRTQPYVGDDHWASMLLHDYTLAKQGDRHLYEPTSPLKPLPPGARPDPSEMVAAPVAKQKFMPDSLPAVPPAELRELLPELAEIAAAAPAAPSEKRAAELAQLLEAGYLAGAADARTAALSKRSIDDAEDGMWAFEAGLTHEDPAMRAQCAFQLGQRRHMAALPILVLRLKYEKDLTVKVWLVDAISQLDCLGGLQTLIDILERPDFGADNARQAAGVASQIIARFGESAGDAPNWRDLRETLARLLEVWKRDGVAPGAAGAGDPAEDPLLDGRLAKHLIGLNGTQLRPIDDARFIYRRIGRVGLPMLRRTLHASEHYVRGHTLEVVVDLGTAAHALAEDILPLIGDVDRRTLPLSLRSLSEMRYEPSLPYLRAWLDTPVVELRAAAAGAIGRLGTAEDYVRLLGLMRDENEAMDVRVQAARSVGLLDPASAFLQEQLDAEGFHAPTLRELMRDIGRQPR